MYFKVFLACIIDFKIIFLFFENNNSTGVREFSDPIILFRFYKNRGSWAFIRQFGHMLNRLPIYYYNVAKYVLCDI